MTEKILYFEKMISRVASSIDHMNNLNLSLIKALSLLNPYFSLLIYFLIIFNYPSYSQSHKVDSLKNELKTCTTDSVCADLMSRIGSQYHYMVGDLDSAKYWFDLSEKRAGNDLLRRGIAIYFKG